MLISFFVKECITTYQFNSTVTYSLLSQQTLCLILSLLSLNYIHICSMILNRTFLGCPSGFSKQIPVIPMFPYFVFCFPFPSSILITKGQINRGALSKLFYIYLLLYHPLSIQTILKSFLLQCQQFWNKTQK